MRLHRSSSARMRSRQRGVARHGPRKGRPVRQALKGRQPSGTEPSSGVYGPVPDVVWDELDAVDEQGTELGCEGELFEPEVAAAPPVATPLPTIPPTSAAPTTMPPPPPTTAPDPDVGGSGMYEVGVDIEPGT